VLDADPRGAERTILDKLRIKAAIVGMIDLLGHHSIEGWANGSNNVGGVDGEMGGGWRSSMYLGRQKGGGAKEKPGQPP
jgi:hypothetical protein